MDFKKQNELALAETYETQTLKEEGFRIGQFEKMAQAEREAGNWYLAARYDEAVEHSQVSVKHSQARLSKIYAEKLSIGAPKELSIPQEEL